MRAWLLVAFVTGLFGFGAQQIEPERNAFVVAHLAASALSFAIALGLGIRGLGQLRAPAERGPVLRGAALVALSVAAMVGAEELATRSDIHWDWTYERRYEFAPATTAALEALGPALRLTLFHDPSDPRARRTRLLLERMAAVAGARVRSESIDDALDDVDRFGVGSSNTVIVERGDDPRERGYAWARVERPGEGTLFEALSQLASREPRVVYATVGTGEGDLARGDDLGFSGLAAALATEGYELKPLPTAFIRDVPADASAVMVIAPERRLSPEALEALRRYLERGGRLLAMLEPGRDSGLEALLEQWGMRSPDAWVVDPASAPLDGTPAGLAPIAFNYALHPTTEGLDRNRVVLFDGARSFELSKPRPEDRLRAVVTGSSQSWLLADAERPDRRRAPLRPPGARRDYHPLLAVGEYRRTGAAPTRIAAFGDADFASNRYLRALYNLDLAMNTLHWLTERESGITLRPKAGAPVQFPLPVQNSLRAFYGVGLLVPELLLLCGGLVWLRRQGA